MKQRNTFTQSNRIVTISELSQLLSKSRVTLWRLTKNKTLPQPIKVQGRTLGWRESTITEWLDSQEVA